VASDCLFILRTAVASVLCVPECICAPKGSLPVSATDALLCLTSVVGAPVALDCPCDTTTSTTSTTTTSTTVTSTVTSTSTTTTVPWFECDVRFRMTSAEAIGNLSFEANYQLIYGLFVGDGDTVECTALASATFDFSNDHAFKILTIGVSSGAGLGGPVDLADCVYLTNDPEFAPEDIRILDVDATAPGAEPVQATVAVSQVSCPLSAASAALAGSHRETAPERPGARD
jgi:hypothetical protein